LRKLDYLRVTNEIGFKIGGKFTKFIESKSIRKLIQQNLS